jgi:sulfur-oxidizing protein SoxY
VTVREASGSSNDLNRRGLIAGAAGVALAPMLGAGAGLANAPAPGNGLAAAIQSITGGAPVTPGRVKLDLPALAENGYSVPLTVSVESPMTAADHVAAIHILSEKNPVAAVVKFTLGPRAGRARVSTNMRLADTQTVLAIARMSDGSFWSGKADVVVTLSACIESV